MLIFLYGEDSYSSRQKLNQIKEKAKKADPSGINSAILFGEKLDFGKFKKAIETPPFLAKKRLAVLVNILKGGSINLKEKISEFLGKNKISDSSVVVFLEDNLPDARQKLFKLLIKKASSENFELLSGFHLNNWIEKKISELSGKIEKMAVNSLASYVGSNLWQMENEIKKLVLSKINEKPSIIKISDVENLVKAQLDDNIFNFIDALASKNKKQALKLLHSQIESGENEIYLLSMITYQFRNMILVSDLAKEGIDQYRIAKETKLHPYVVKKTMWNINRFNIARLREIYNKLLEIDIGLKRTNISPVLSLDMLVCELCK